MDDVGQLELLQRIARAVGVTGSVSELTIGKLWLLYKTTIPRGRRWQHERNLVKPFVVRFWRRQVAAVGPTDWAEHRRQRRREPTRLGRPPGDLTINMELAATKRMFKWAVRKKHIAERPLIDVKPAKARGRRESWFTAEQITKLIAASWALRWDHQQRTFRALVAVMADTGARISEALSLRWDRITLQGTTPVIGKGGKTRVLGFTPRATRAMVGLGRHSNPHVFTNWRTAKVYNASTVRRWFRDAIAAAGLEGVKADGDLALVPHILRHSFASIADERGARAEDIQAALGHEHASTTRVYLHRNEANAAMRMAAIMAKPAERRPPRRAASEKYDGAEKEVVKLNGGRLTSLVS